MPTLATTNVQSPDAKICKAVSAAGTISTRHSSASSTCCKAVRVAESSSITNMLTVLKGHLGSYPRVYRWPEKGFESIVEACPNRSTTWVADEHKAKLSS